ncbi:MAG TPA: ATP-binding cassette domain-containing protein [Actinophytocola sp.]|nr:ATP-binding cassette domain-containing protein [Actinophytocola sp.]
MPAAVLEIDRITKRYGHVVACEDVSLTVAPGELFGLVGGDGAGRTTTLRVALGVLPPDSGEVRLGGEPVTLAVRRRIGYLPEERGLYPRMRLLDQLVYLAELHGMDTGDAHRAADHWTARLGLRDRRGDAARRLSLGDQQRARLAAALVHGPDVLVLDEPFAGLDPVAVDAVGEVLRERAAAGAPVLFSARSLELAERWCDRIGVIHNGRMVVQGTVAELGAAGSGEVVVDAPAAPAGWADGLTGVRILGVHNGRTRLLLGEDADDQAVLAAALATGPVREFTRQRPTLAELYRDVVP